MTIQIAHARNVTTRTRVSWCAGSGFAMNRLMESHLNESNDLTELLRRAGARACTRCGVQSLVAAHDDRAVVWFCFECGHEEHGVPGGVASPENFE